MSFAATKGRREYFVLASFFLFVCSFFLYVEMLRTLWVNETDVLLFCLFSFHVTIPDVA